MLCRCLQRSVLRPYQLILSSYCSFWAEMLHLIFNQIMSPILAFVFSPTPFLNKIFKDTCLFICDFERSFLSFWNSVLSIGAWPPGELNGKAVLSEGHWYLWESGTCGLESWRHWRWNQWEIILSNSYLPQPTASMPLASSTPSQVLLLFKSTGYNI